MASRRQFVVAAGLWSSWASALESHGGVGRLPALGWNSWNEYGCNITEMLFLDTAKSVVTLGLQAAGYEYVNIDDCWSDKAQPRDDQSQQLRADAETFPHGIKWLADSVHGLGLKLGIYSDAGTNTCARYGGSLGHEAIDASTFAQWGVDYLKYDNCYVPAEWADQYSYFPEYDGLVDPSPPGYDWASSTSAQRFGLMRDALLDQEFPPSAAPGRTIQYSVCIWGGAFVERWGNKTAHSWRMWADILPEWASIAEILNHAAFKANTTNFWSHGDWDMLEVGNGALTYEESKTHFAFWAALKSPLIIGTRLEGIKPEILQILTNKELLAFNQDPTVGEAATPYKWGITPDYTYDKTQPAEFWSGLSERGTHVFVLNSLAETRNMTIDLAEVPGLDGDSQYVLHDMWTGEDIGVYSGAYHVELVAHASVALLVTPAPGVDVRDEGELRL